MPQPDALGENCTFNAFRILKQDVQAFEAYLDQTATELLGHKDVHELLAPDAEKAIAAGLSRPRKPPIVLSRHGAMREVMSERLDGTNAETTNAPDVKRQFDSNGLPTGPQPQAPNGIN